MNRTLILSLTSFLLATNLPANEPKEVTAARKEYEKAQPKDEAARLRYVTVLANAVHGYVVEFHDTGSRKHGDELQALSKELGQHPAPKDSDSKKLTQLMVGKWETTRHDFIYRKDGTYSMLPIEEGTTSGKWHIEGNQFIQTEGAADARYTITLLNKDCLVYGDKDGVFLMARMK